MEGKKTRTTTYHLVIVSEGILCNDVCVCGSWMNLHLGEGKNKEWNVEEEEEDYLGF